MKSNKIVREEIIRVIDNQMNNNDPPETRITYDRLRKEGFDDVQCKQMIGQCVAVELFEIIKFEKPFDLIRYINNLNLLPKEPFD
jgi:hypothetical protein